MPRTIPSPSPWRTTLARLSLVLAALVWPGGPGTAAAAEPESLLAIRNHRFEPADLKVPANQRVKLIVHNQDASPEEFESRQLSREKIVPAGAKVSIFIGPLKPGRYEFWGEYHDATARGVVIAE